MKMTAKKLKRLGLLWPALIIAGVVAGITVLVRYAGTDSIAVHLYYLPIMYAGYVFGDYGAIVVSLFSTLLCGPWMAARYELDKPIMQTPADMLVRMCTFYVVGLAASRASLELKRRAAEAHMLYEVARSITSTLRLHDVLDLIAQSARHVMDAKGCVIRLLDEDTDELVPAAMSGLSQEYWQKGKVVGAASPVNGRALTGEAVQILDVTQEEGFQYPEAARDEGISSVLTLPLRTKSGTCGIIRIYAKRKHRFTEQEIQLLTTFADQAAVAIENAELYEDIRRNYYETVRALTTAVEAKDAATYKHSERVSEVADRLAEAMGLDADEREMLRFGCILHDIGKIGVHEEALEARDTETPEQIFYQMHPLIGASILRPIGFLEPALDIVKHHHERWDGDGFPEGLKGQDIPLSARIVAVVDAFDRVQYAGGRGVKTVATKAALLEIVSRAGSEFDPGIVGKFHKMMLGADGAQAETEPDAEPASSAHSSSPPESGAAAANPTSATDADTEDPAATDAAPTPTDE